jgi:hypothetical protein
MQIGVTSIVTMLSCFVHGIVGCSDTRVYSSDYDRSCQASYQCIVVVSGDLCECGQHCGAISAADEERYQRDIQDSDGFGLSVSPGCGEDDPVSRCRELEAGCVNGVCRIVSPDELGL